MSSSANEPFSQLQEVLLEFRAGKMQLDGKRVIPDSRKGLVRIGRGEEGLVHVQWLDRSQNIVEDDHIVFPEEAVFEKINQSSGRVYILKFHTDDRKFFYWMQEPNAEGDILLCNSVNFYLNLELPEDESDASVPIPSVEHLTEDEISSRAGNLVGPSMGAEATSDVTSAGPVKLAYLQRILSNIGGGSSELPEDESDASVPIPSVEHLAEDNFSSRAGNLVGPSMGAEATSDVTSAGPVKLADLQRILSNIGGGSSAEAVDPEAGLGLGDILRPEFIRPLIQELTVDQELAYYLPDGQWTPEDLVELLQSPPFRQQLDSFTYVLRTGQVDLTQFGIDPSKYKFTVPSFLESLEDSVTKTSEESGQWSNDAMDEGQ